MASISLKHVDVEFPIYDRRTRSLKRALSQTVGGVIRGDGNGPTLVRALNDINLEFRDGDRVALIGRNGSGKTTLLRVMGKIYDPTAGSAEIIGRVTSMTDLMMGTDHDETGYENIRLRSIFMGMSTSQAKNIIEDVEDFTELGEFLSLPIRSYSAGMLLRLCFAISTAVMPDIVIMDELINVGDAAFLAKANQRLSGVIERTKIIIIATHDIETSRQFCNKAVLMEGGYLIAQGTPDEMWELYRQRSNV